MKLAHKVALAGFLALAACSIPKPTAFYQTPAVKNAAPGTVISIEPYSPAVKDAAAYRILYNSTGIDGAVLPVSGVVYIPLAPPPPQGRNVVAWAHPTTGIAPGCAPSLNAGGAGTLGLADSIPGLVQFIADGDIVTATDYPGLGAPGIHPYLVGAGEARSIIDSARAARTLPGADISGKYVVWGHSQGGQAALFTGQISKSYAPELTLVGVVAAAPPTDMKVELTEPFRNNGGRMVAAYVYHAWSQTYHVPITSIVAPQAVPTVNNVATKCINTFVEAVSALHAASALNPMFLDHPPQTTPPWPELLSENSPGHAPPGAPLLILQGSTDITVEPRFTRAFVAGACAKHEIVDYQESKGVGHLLIAIKSLPVVTAWIHARFIGATPPVNCRAG
jgi:pimeloyl-ACP methyl ester carboxylesterase